MHIANTAIKRFRHLIPTVEAVSYELGGAKFFSKLDLSQAYHQLDLDELSRHITTFSTHKVYSFELWYKCSCRVVPTHPTTQGIKGVTNIADDILMFRSTQEDHDRALKACLERLSEKGLVLNSSKCSFHKKELSFFGQIFSQKGT